MFIVVSILLATALCSVATLVEESLYGEAPIGNSTLALPREKRFFGLFGIGAALMGAKIVACRKNDHFVLINNVMKRFVQCSSAVRAVAEGAGQRAIADAATADGWPAQRA